MADEIKAIAKFSEDAIAIALNTLSAEEWTHFQKGLNIISENLGEKKEKKKSEPKSQTVSEDAVFKQDVLPAICRSMLEIEKRELNNIFDINVSFDVKTSFADFTLEEIVSEHEILIMTEEQLKSLALFAQLSRGLLYVELASKLNENGRGFKEFVEKSGMLNVSYMTVLRYMTLASIITTYPRLILCQLSFTQILKHKKRLLNFLKSEEGQYLNSKLSLSFEIVAQGRKVTIQRAEMKTTDNKFSTDPDWVHHDSRSKMELSDESINKVHDHVVTTTTTSPTPNHAVVVRDTAYIAGLIGNNPETAELVSDDIADQTDQALKNLGTVLQSIGATYTNVVKITLLLADIADYGAVNEVYFKYFPDHHPARTCYSVLDMPKKAKIEIESIAALGDLQEV